VVISGLAVLSRPGGPGRGAGDRWPVPANGVRDDEEIMEIILRTDVKELGARGQIVQVKPGYARNFLFPKGLAAPATDEAKRQIERDRERERKQEEERKKQVQELSQRLEKTSCTITAQANEQGNLFGSVTAEHIAAAFAEEGISLTPDQILLPEPIKEIGVYGFTIRLRPEIEVTSKVWVVKQ
jgi:large subunit ribosomal protein L9